MQVDTKIFEVDTVVCRRQHRGAIEYLVTWKGFDEGTATWEPVENLSSCADLLASFHRITNPIPGANPFSIQNIGKAKKIHIKTLMTRKSGGHKRSKSMAEKEDLKPVVNNKKSDLRNAQALNFSAKKSKQKISESERLMYDTLVHESKTMDPLRTNGAIDIASCANASLFQTVQKRSLNRNSLSHNIYDKDLVLSVIKNGYLELTLNNADNRNLLTQDMLAILTESLYKARLNSNVKAVLLRNTGSHFCSGVDYEQLIACNDDKEYRIKVARLVSLLKSFLGEYLLFPKPIICAINGCVLELGVSLVAGADFAYSTSKTNFDLAYSRLGLSPIGYLTKSLSKAVGAPMALSMMYMSILYSAVTMYDKGLLLDMYGINSFEEDITKFMQKITQSSLQSLQSTKKLVKHHNLEEIDKICSEELSAYQTLLLSKETKQTLREEWPVLISMSDREV